MVEESARRLEWVEAHEEIGQLACRYALAFDQRDVEALVSLFVEDAETPDGMVGPSALARWFEEAMRASTISIHLVTGHQVDLRDQDRASGVVSTRAEYQVGDRWIVAPLQHWDRYERRHGRWKFVDRQWHAFYAAELGRDPGSVPGRFDLPGHAHLHAADLPEALPTWRAFWQARTTGR